jgi:hypothetical protein
LKTKALCSNAEGFLHKFNSRFREAPSEIQDARPEIWYPPDEIWNAHTIIRDAPDEIRNAHTILQDAPDEIRDAHTIFQDAPDEIRDAHTIFRDARPDFHLRRNFGEEKDFKNCEEGSGGLLGWEDLMG